MGSMITLEGVSRFYQMGEETIKAVEEINLQIKDGEFAAVMGPSGSGKSTLLNLIGTLDRPTSGRIVIGDQDTGKMNDRSVSRFRNQTIGFVFQSFNLQPIYTALENVMLPMFWKNVSGKERLERAQKTLTEVGLADRMNFRPAQLSGGQRQRVSIARAIVNQPQIILADEPTGNLDSKTGDEIIARLKKINQNAPATVIVITHDVEVARQAHRVVKLKDGRIIK